MQELEEKIAHLTRVVEDLSDVVARQDADLRKLQDQMDRVIRREAEREQDASGGIVLGDERPPHY